jgi:hypothetical protein
LVQEMEEDEGKREGGEDDEGSEDEEYVERVEEEWGFV